MKSKVDVPVEVTVGYHFIKPFLTVGSINDSMAIHTESLGQQKAIDIVVLQRGGG